MCLILSLPCHGSAIFYGPAKQAVSRFTQGLSQYGQGLMQSASPAFRWGQTAQQALKRSSGDFSKYILSQSKKLGNQSQKLGNQWQKLSFGDKTALMTTPMASLWLLDKSGLRQQSSSAASDIKSDWDKLMASRRERQRQERDWRKQMDAIRSSIVKNSASDIMAFIMFNSTIPVGSLYFNYVDKNANERVYFIEEEGEKNLFWDAKSRGWYEGQALNNVRKKRGEPEVYLAEYGEWRRG